jgi:hypothetical protein
VTRLADVAIRGELSCARALEHGALLRDDDARARLAARRLGGAPGEVQRRRGRGLLDLGDLREVTSRSSMGPVGTRCV